MAGGKGRGKHSEQQDWQRPAGAFSGKAKKDFIKWKRKQKGARANQEEQEEAQEAAAARGAPGGARHQQQLAAQAAAGRRKWGTGPPPGSNAPLHYVPLMDVGGGSITKDQQHGGHSAADARLPMVVPGEVGFSAEGRTLGMPVRPAWQGVVHSAEALHVLEEASFQAWLNGLQQRYGFPSTAPLSTDQPSSHGQAAQHGISHPTSTESTSTPTPGSNSTAEEAEEQAVPPSVVAGSSTAWASDTAAVGGNGRLGFFETRLDFWRQLWRALEMSDMAVMIVDARCPLLHFSEALYYHATADQGLQVALLLNKCDLVPEPAITAWRSFFSQHYPDITVLAASSAADPDGAATCILGWVLQAQVNRAGRPVHVADYIQLGLDELIAESIRRNTHAKRKPRQASCSRQAKQPGQSSQGEEDEAGMLRAGTARQRRRAAQRLRAAADEASSSSQEDPSEHSSSLADSDSESKDWEETASADDDEGHDEAVQDPADACQGPASAAAAALESLTLEGHMQQHQHQRQEHSDETDSHFPATLQTAAATSAGLQPVVVCVVGEPNVGKSSTLNALLGTHRLAVSSHPGRTKHYQTHFMAPGLMLCDSPGVVFPRLDVRLPLQVLFGSFPIARCSDPYTAIRYLAERLWPRLHQRLSLSRQAAEDGEQSATSSTPHMPSTQHDGCDEPAWTPMALCEALAAKHSWRIRRGGRLDTYRTANWLLRAALGGREGLVLAFMPPPAL